MFNKNLDQLIWEKDSFPRRINDTEDVILVCRQDLVILGFKFLFLLSLSIVLLIIRVIISGSISDIFWLSLYDTIMYSVNIILLVAFTLTFHNYYLSLQVVTSERVIDIDQRGIFSREVNEMSLEKIEDITYKLSGLAGVIFNFGNVILQSTSSSSPGNPLTEDKMNGFVFNNVPHPKEIADEISNTYQRDQENEYKTAAKYNAHFLAEELNDLKQHRGDSVSDSSENNQ